MTILPDWQIIARCMGFDEAATDLMVIPFDLDLVNPASLDVRLGDTLLIESAQGPELVRYPLGERNSQDNPYLLVPGQFVLAHTVERFNLPDDIAAQFMLKSSRAREGLEHLMAGYADPGFYGVMTLELCNSRQLHPVPLWAGMKIGQMIFQQMAAAPQRSYALTGRYNGQLTAWESLG